MHFVSAHQRTDLVFLPDTKNVGAHHAQLADTDTTRAEKDQRAKSPGESRVHLDLGDGGLAHGGVPDAKPGYALLAEGAVENAIRAELLPQPDGTAKHASKGHVLPEHDLKNKKRQRNDKNAATPPRRTAKSARFCLLMLYYRLLYRQRGACASITFQAEVLTESVPRLKGTFSLSRKRSRFLHEHELKRKRRQNEKPPQPPRTTERDRVWGGFNRI